MATNGTAHVDPAVGALHHPPATGTFSSDDSDDENLTDGRKPGAPPALEIGAERQPEGLLPWTPTGTSAAAAGAPVPTSTSSRASHSTQSPAGARGGPPGAADSRSGATSSSPTAAAGPGAATKDSARDAVAAAVFRARRAPPTGKSLFVSELHEDTEFGELHDLFAKFGGLVSCRVLRDAKTGKSRRLGYVNFESNEAAKAALDATNGQPGPHGAPIVATYADNDPSFVPAPPKRLFVRFIPLTATENDVRAAFAKYGELTGIELARDTCRAAKKEPLPWQMGYVTFERTEDATKALAECDRSFLLGDLHHLVVKVAEDPSTKTKRQQWREQAHAAVASEAKPQEQQPQAQRQQQQQQSQQQARGGATNAKGGVNPRRVADGPMALRDASKPSSAPGSAQPSPTTSAAQRAVFGAAQQPPSPHMFMPPKPPTPSSWATPVNTPSANQQPSGGHVLASGFFQPGAAAPPPYPAGSPQSNNPPTPHSTTPHGQALPAAYSGAQGVSPTHFQHATTQQFSSQQQPPAQQQQHHQQPTTQTFAGAAQQRQQAAHQSPGMQQPALNVNALPPFGAQPAFVPQHAYAQQLQSQLPQPMAAAQQQQHQHQHQHQQYHAAPSSMHQPSSVFTSVASGNTVTPMSSTSHQQLPMFSGGGQPSQPQAQPPQANVWAAPQPQVQVAPRAGFHAHMPYPQMQPQYAQAYAPADNATQQFRAAYQHQPHHPPPQQPHQPQSQPQQDTTAASNASSSKTQSPQPPQSSGIALNALPSFGGGGGSIFGGGGGGGAREELVEPDTSGMLSQFVSSMRTNTMGTMSTHATRNAIAGAEAAMAAGHSGKPEVDTSGQNQFSGMGPTVSSVVGAPAGAGAADAPQQLFMRTSDGQYVPVSGAFAPSGGTAP